MLRPNFHNSCPERPHSFEITWKELWHVVASNVHCTVHVYMLYMTVHNYMFYEEMLYTLYTSFCVSMLKAAAQCRNLFAEGQNVRPLTFFCKLHKVQCSCMYMYFLIVYKGKNCLNKVLDSCLRMAGSSSQKWGHLLHGQNPARFKQLLKDWVTTLVFPSIQRTLQIKIFIKILVV